MTEDQVRALVRDAIARRRGTPSPTAPRVEMPRADAPQAHISHHRFALPAGDGACLIEPAVRCNHCGFCQSYGH
jgi:hypothetical protein